MSPLPADQGTTGRRHALELLSDTLGREAHHLLRTPGLLWQQAYNLLEWEADPASTGPLSELLARGREARRGDRSRPWFRLTTPPRESSLLRRTLMGHEMQVRSCAFSAEGTTVVSLSFDRTLRLWDPATGLERARTATEPELLTRILAVSPSHNHVACVRSDFAICVWDAAAGRLEQTLVGHTAAVNDCAFSTDGRRLASAGSDGTLRTWDVANGREVVTIVGVTPAARRIALARDGARAVSAGSADTLTLWNAESGDKIADLAGHTDSINWCSFSPDDRLVASASDDETLRVWDAATGGCLAVLRGHTDAVLSASFSPSGETLLSAALDETARLWELPAGRELAVLQGHGGPVNAVCFSPDGQLAITASDDGAVGVWDTLGGRLVAMLEGHSDAVNSVAFSLDGRTVASGSDDKTVKLWDVPNRAASRNWSVHSDWVVSATFSSDSRWAATGGRDKTVRLWDPAAGRVVAVLEGHTATPDSCAIAPGVPLLVSASSKETLSWTLSPDGHADLVDRIQGSEVVRFSHDGRYLLLADGASPVLVDLQTGQETTRYRGFQGDVTCACFSADDRLVLSGSVDRTLRLWDRESAAAVATFAGHSDIVTGCAFSPDGQLVASSSRDATVRLWEVPSGRERMKLSGHTLPCTCCAFAPDGSAVLSGSSDTTVRSWNVETGEGRVVFYALGCIECLELSPDGRWLCVGDWGGNAYMLAVEGPQSPELQPRTPDVGSASSAVIEFYPADLLHKFGFGDGDMLYDFVQEHGLGVDDRHLLVAVVERLVVPQLDQVVETYTVGTMHNPVRALTIDGEQADIDSTLTPDTVEVSESEIIRIAQTLPASGNDGEV